jgi:LuxR family maltose regulon positive regulatory protein
LYQEALAIAAERGLGFLPIIGNIQAALAIILYEWNDLVAAETLIDKAIEWGKRADDPQTLMLAYSLKMRMALGKRDFQQANQWLRPAEELIQTRSLWRWHVGRFVANRMRLWSLEGNLEAIRHWLESCGLDIEDEANYLNESEYSAFSRALITVGQPQQALALLGRMEAVTGKDGRRLIPIELPILKSLAWYHQGETEKALTELLNALAASEPEGHIHIYVDEDEPIARLLRLAQARGHFPAYTTRLLAALSDIGSQDSDFGITHSAIALYPATNPQSAMVESLSGREVEILQLVAAGLSNRAIAEKLVITVGTVKRHLNNIFGKLGVESRTQAIMRGRELGLIQ